MAGVITPTIIPTLDLTPTTYAAGSKCCNVPMLKIECCSRSQDIVLVYDASTNTVGPANQKEEKSSRNCLKKIFCCFTGCFGSEKRDLTRGEKREGLDKFFLILKSEYGPILEKDISFLSKKTHSLLSKIKQKEEITDVEACKLQTMLKEELPSDARKALKEAKYVERQDDLTGSQWTINLNEDESCSLDDFKCEVITRLGQKESFNDETMRRRLGQLKVNREEEKHLSDKEIEEAISLIKRDLMQESKQVVPINDLRTLVIKAVHTLNLSLETAHTVEQIEDKIKASKTKDEFLAWINGEISDRESQSNLPEKMSGHESQNHLQIEV